MEVAPGSSDVLVASPISYGQFLPVAPSANPWVEWRAATFTVQKGYSADLTAIPYLALASAGQRVSMATANGQRATPAVTPVIAPRWNGVLDALVDQAGVTTTPALSWTAPTVGGSSYTVSIWRLGTTATVPSTSTATLVASWVTSGTNVRVPPNLLAAGTFYFARIDVRARTNDGFDGAPFRSRDLSGWASTLTATFTP